MLLVHFLLLHVSTGCCPLLRKLQQPYHRFEFPVLLLDFWHQSVGLGKTQQFNNTHTMLCEVFKMRIIKKVRNPTFDATNNVLPCSSEFSSTKSNPIVLLPSSTSYTTAFFSTEIVCAHCIECFLLAKRNLLALNLQWLQIWWNCTQSGFPKEWQSEKFRTHNHLPREFFESMRGWIWNWS